MTTTQKHRAPLTRQNYTDPWHRRQPVCRECIYAYVEADHEREDQP